MEPRPLGINVYFFDLQVFQNSFSISTFYIIYHVMVVDSSMEHFVSNIIGNFGLELSMTPSTQLLESSLIHS